MTVTKRSWHYRYWLWLHPPKSSGPLAGVQMQPKNLCSYIQSMFWASAFFGLLIAGLLVGIGAGLYALYLHAHDAAIVLLILLVVAAWLLIMFGYAVPWADRKEREEDQRLADKLAGKPVPERRHGLLWTWAAAQKRRVCPVIEVVEA